LADSDLHVLGYARWSAGLEAGVAAHHAGMVPPFKEAVEACFAEGLVKVVFATETLALGINMPARTVVIEKLTKFTGERHEFLTPGDYTQLTGRAGRRGIDPVGHAVVLWSPFVPFEQVAALAASRSFRLVSAFRPTFNMAANLVRRYEAAEAHHLLNLSFAQFQADASVVALETRLEKRSEVLAGLEVELECERGDVAEYAALLAAQEEDRR
jgi:ATP-dependent RNA helicase HelY